MLKYFLYFIESKNLIINKKQTTLLAVSGGVDSVVLTYLFKKAELPFAIVHCNFNLRGIESEMTSKFVKELAAFYKVSFYTAKFETKYFAYKNKVSIQMAARILRYNFFKKLLQQYKYNKIATAHHWDDSVETILLNFIKGTNIQGLYGITSIRSLSNRIQKFPLKIELQKKNVYGHIIRPIIFARKKEILTYAQQEKLYWCEDSSNLCNNHYQRNFIRNKIIPILHKVNPNFEKTIQETVTKLKEIGTFFNQHIYQISKKIMFNKQDVYYLEIHKIIHQPWASTVAFEILRPYGFTFKQIQNFIKNPISSGKMIHTIDYTLYVDRKNWFIKQKKIPFTQKKVVTSTIQYTTYGNYNLYFHIYNSEHYILKKNIMSIAALDYDQLIFPLIIRPWKYGDFFYPIGMQGRKKISDLLIDLKIPMYMKQEVFVITSDDQIIWVVSYRIDERFKVKNTTKKIFEIVYNSI